MFKIITDSHYLGREDIILTHNFEWHHMLKIKFQNIDQLSLHVDLFIFYALMWPYFWKKKLNNKSEHISKRKIEGRPFWGGSNEKMCWMRLGWGNEVARTPPLVQYLQKFVGVLNFTLHIQCFRLNYKNISLNQEDLWKWFLKTLKLLHIFMLLN